MATTLFLCYRREDTEDAAGRLRDRLVEVYGEDGIFMDIDSIPLGADFVKLVNTRVRSCQLMIVLIGKRWLKIKDRRRRRRLDNPDDYVRAEIAAALIHQVPLIPVLVQGATMPIAEDLPEDIRPLGHRNGDELRAKHWREDVKRLIEKLDVVVKERRSEARLVPDPKKIEAIRGPRKIPMPPWQ